MPNRDANKRKISMSIADNKVDLTSLCFKCGGHGHYAVVFPSKVLHFCIEEVEFELWRYQKKDETRNEYELSEECNYYDGRPYFSSATFISCPKGENRRSMMY